MLASNNQRGTFNKTRAEVDSYLVILDSDQKIQSCDLQRPIMCEPKTLANSNLVHSLDLYMLYSVTYIQFS